MSAAQVSLCTIDSNPVGIRIYSQEQCMKATSGYNVIMRRHCVRSLSVDGFRFGIIGNYKEHYMRRVLGLLLLVPLLASALPTGDTQGIVAAVRIKSPVSGVNSFEIWFSSTTNDRFGCIQSSGYVVVSEGTSQMTNDSFKLIFATALAAQSAGKPLALDSWSANPCESVINAWMVN